MGRIVVAVIIWSIAGSMMIGYITYKFISKRKSKPSDEDDLEIPDNAPEVKNFWLGMTNGYISGYEKKRIESPEGRELVHFINKVKDPEKETIKLYKFVLGKGRRVEIHQGNYKLIEYYPPEADNLPIQFRRNEKGIIVMDYLTNLTSQNDTIEIYKGAYDKSIAMQKQRPLGEATRQELDLQKKLQKQVEELAQGKGGKL